ncbi:MarR family transcriptional regulator [bacterium]|nr:MAG: MarR family transcriptional regulator [bacterium]
MQVDREEFGLSAASHQSWGVMLRAHAKAVERVGRQVEAEGGLPLDWYDVLLVLEYAPHGSLRMGELAEHVTLSRSGLTRLIDRIEAAGFVERNLSPCDRRVFVVRLTPKGRDARQRSWPIYARAIAAGFGSRYKDDEAQLLGELLLRQIQPE